MLGWTKRTTFSPSFPRPSYVLGWCYRGCSWFLTIPADKMDSWLEKSIVVFGERMVSYRKFILADTFLRILIVNFLDPSFSLIFNHRCHASQQTLRKWRQITFLIFNKIHLTFLYIIMPFSFPTGLAQHYFPLLFDRMLFTKNIVYP